MANEFMSVRQIGIKVVHNGRVLATGGGRKHLCFGGVLFVHNRREKHLVDRAGEAANVRL